MNGNQRPPGEPDDRHVDELPLEEEFQHRDAPVQQVLEHDDVDPRLVVAVDHARRDTRAVQPGDIPLRALGEAHPPAVARDPENGSICTRTGFTGMASDERQQEDREHQKSVLIPSSSAATTPALAGRKVSKALLGAARRWQPAPAADSRSQVIERCTRS
jgi:hypothetical protein